VRAVTRSGESRTKRTLCYCLAIIYRAVDLVGGSQGAATPVFRPFCESKRSGKTAKHFQGSPNQIGTWSIFG